MIFSIPNLKKYLKNKWVNCLCFEHTILLTEKVVDYLLNKHQLKIIEKQYFTNHSIFYRCIKDNFINANQVTLKNEYNENKKLFQSMQKFYKDKIAYLNTKMKDYENVYLFGAHIFSQYLIYRGLQLDKIKMILDNNPNKHKKRLYGTNLWVDSPEILKDDSNALVILNAGIYNDEIERGIMKLNNNTKVVKCH